MAIKCNIDALIFCPFETRVEPLTVYYKIYLEKNPTQLQNLSISLDGTYIFMKFEATLIVLKKSVV